MWKQTERKKVKTVETQKCENIQNAKKIKTQKTQKNLNGQMASKVRLTLVNHNNINNNN